jgi:hypothetical protein
MMLCAFIYRGVLMRAPLEAFVVVFVVAGIKKKKLCHALHSNGLLGVDQPTENPNS